MKTGENTVLQLTADKTQNLKEFTENNYAQASFFWNYLLKNKEIKVNGKRVGSDTLLQAGDTVQYYLTRKQEEKPAFYTVYEDENILIADKESGVNSEAVFAALCRERECYFIHRLDRNTCGLLAFALNPNAEKALLGTFKEKRVEKRYHALCFGGFTRSADVLTAYLKKDAEKSLVHIYDTPVNGAERIVTEYKVLAQSDGLTKAEIVLHTGKTHQIRAHLAHIGCPIVGDMKYGNSAQNKAKNATRQCLVAKYLRFDLDGEFAYLNDFEWSSRFETEI
jgi:23S rRNA pseudouridine955/2504/2580 synthase